MGVECAHWREYDSVGGPVSFCDIAAFSKKLTAQELRLIGCTAEKRQACSTTMEMNVGAAAVPIAAPVPLHTSCDLPKTVATNTVGIAEKKAASPLFNLLVLGILAGCYIALAGVLSTVVTNDLAKFVGDGMSRLISGMVFSLGLILVVIGGAELFTGNTLMVTGWLDGQDNRPPIGQKLDHSLCCQLFRFDFIGLAFLLAAVYGSLTATWLESRRF